MMNDRLKGLVLGATGGVVGTLLMGWYLMPHEQGELPAATLDKEPILQDTGIIA